MGHPPRRRRGRRPGRGSGRPAWGDSGGRTRYGIGGRGCRRRANRVIRHVPLGCPPLVHDERGSGSRGPAVSRLGPSVSRVGSDVIASVPATACRTMGKVPAGTRSSKESSGGYLRPAVVGVSSATRGRALRVDRDLGHPPRQPGRSGTGRPRHRRRHNRRNRVNPEDSAARRLGRRGCVGGDGRLGVALGFGLGGRSLWRPRARSTRPSRPRTGAARLIMGDSATHGTRRRSGGCWPRPRFVARPTPTSESWLNQVDRPFAVTTGRQVRRAGPERRGTRVRVCLKTRRPGAAVGASGASSRRGSWPRSTRS